MSRLNEIDENAFYSTETTVELDRDSYEWLVSRVEELEKIEGTRKRGFNISIKCENCDSEDWSINTEKEVLDRFHGAVSVSCLNCGNYEEIQ